MDVYADSCDEVCAKHYRLNIQAVGNLARKGGHQKAVNVGERGLQFYSRCRGRVIIDLFTLVCLQQKISGVDAKVQDFVYQGDHLVANPAA